MRPQHLQQHDRYLENLIEGRARHARPHNWGFTGLSLERELLEHGKVAIASCSGVFPDGTPLAVPNDDFAPPPLEIPESARDVIVYLTLPHRRRGGIEVASGGADESMARHKLEEQAVADSNASGGPEPTLQVAKLRLRLMLQTDELADHTLLGIARVIERQTDGQVVLDEDYIAPCLQLDASSRLKAIVERLNGQLGQRGESLSKTVSDSGRGGAAEWADFLILQTVNRFEPLLRHLSATPGVHPETLYQCTVQLAGDLATFRSPRRPGSFGEYRHDALRETFAPVMASLLESLVHESQKAAIPIELKARKFGIKLAMINDKALLQEANFVLAVSADLPEEKIRQNFPNQAKIGPPEMIANLIQAALPGIALRPLPVAPRQIPFHAGHTYFELDRGSEYWSKLDSGFAIQCGGDYPGLEMEFWAIRG